MNLTFIQTIILFCLNKLNGERTIYSIYHLLHGKKSSQTIQDAHLFQLSALFHTDTTISRTILEKTVTEFMQHHLITQVDVGRFILTAEGEKSLSTSLNQYPIPVYLNGWKYDRTGDVFWERISLTVQVISNLQHQEAQYMPVQRKSETHVWMKAFLKHHMLNRDNLAQKLYMELISCLESNISINPDLFVIRLSGYRTVGLTEEQAATNLGMEISYYHYQFLNIVHFLIQHIENNKQQFPVLFSLLDQTQMGSLTISTQKTFTLIEQGYSVEDIMKIRRLKQSTIEDHLVELALHLKEFPIDHYMSTNKQAGILHAIKSAHSKQLKEIRKLIPEANYFEIRLVMAKYGDET